MEGTSVLEICESALKHNLRFLRDLIGPEVRLCSIVKGNAYGHGVSTFVPVAERCGVRSFGAYSADEARQVVRNRTQNSEVMIIGCAVGDELTWTIENDVSFYVFDSERLRHAIDIARKCGRPARIHLELETGMNRLGLDGAELHAVVDLIRTHPEHVIPEGVCTHYAGAESVGNFLRVQRQKEVFSRQCRWLENEGIHPRYHHTASSAAAVSHPDTRMNMVRIGIMQYGYWPSEETRMQYVLEHGGIPVHQPRDPLRRVLRWKSSVMSVKEVSPGEFVGYGTSLLTVRPSRFAAVPVGYYHGFNRNLSNRGHVLIHGRRAPVSGIVNMNMMMVDVTDIPGVKPGDEVVLIGKQKRAEVSVGAFSDLTRFLNYEVLVRLSPDIPRVVVK